LLCCLCHIQFSAGRTVHVHKDGTLRPPPIPPWDERQRILYNS
jgi:hypothetical protein